VTYGVTAPDETGIDQQAAAERLAELITSSWISHAIGAGIEIGLFDAVCNGPTAIEELARGLDCAPGALRQLVRSCEALELCRIDAQGYCAATPMGRLLASRSEGSQQAWARLWCGDLATLWSGLAESIRHGASVRSLRGIPAGFGHLAADPARAEAFNRAMTANTWWVAEAFARLPALCGCQHVVDIGDMAAAGQCRQPGECFRHPPGVRSHGTIECIGPCWVRGEVAEARGDAAQRSHARAAANRLGQTAPQRGQIPAPKPGPGLLRSFAA
jgi:hypothetical protein